MGQSGGPAKYFLKENSPYIVYLFVQPSYSFLQLFETSSHFERLYDGTMKITVETLPCT